MHTLYLISCGIAGMAVGWAMSEVATAIIKHIMHRNDDDWY